MKCNKQSEKNRIREKFIKKIESNPLVFFQTIGIEKLKITASGQAQGCCPFHHDRNPSFSINIANGTWICHAGCGAGNIRTFLQRIGEIRFIEPVSTLVHEGDE